MSSKYGFHHRHWKSLENLENNITDITEWQFFGTKRENKRPPWPFVSFRLGDSNKISKQKEPK
jgi:hypothetical protein